MSIKVNIPWFLRQLINEVEVAEVDGSTVGECLEHLVEQFPIIKQKLFNDKTGKLFDYIDIYVNRESSYPEESAKPVKDGDEIHIILIIDGG